MNMSTPQFNIKKKPILNLTLSQAMIARWIAILLLSLFYGLTFAPIGAFAAWTDHDIQSELDSSGEYEWAPGNTSYLFTKPTYLASQPNNTFYTTADLYRDLAKLSTSYLPQPKWIPIAGEITLFIPNYSIDKQLGDEHVQASIVRAQIHRALGRQVINDVYYGDETNQFKKLYEAAYNYAIEKSLVFGTPLTNINPATLPNMIWPERRQVRNEFVYVPVLYLNSNTINTQRVNSSVNEWTGATVDLANATIGTGSQMNLRGTFLTVTNNLRVAGTLNVSEDAKILVKGSLAIDGGSVIARSNSADGNKGNLSITANNIDIKSIVQVSRNQYGQVATIGSIAQVNSDGSMLLRSYGDINIAGAQIRSNDTLTLAANGDISIGGTALTNIFNGKDGGWNTSSTTTEYIASTLSSKDALQLIADGAIEINGANISSDEGQLKILAGLGITIQDHQNFSELHRKGKFRKTTANEDAYKTVAIRSLLDAGKDVVINSELGDITLKATAISSVEGTKVTATSGGVNMLVTTENDHYNYSSVKKSLLTVKSTSRGHAIENVVDNTIVGGIEVEALKGLTVEYKGDPALTLEQQIDVVANLPGMEWMRTINVDKSSASWKAINAKYESWDKTQTGISPALAAVISVAMAVATSGASTGWFEAAMAAGATTLETQLVLAIANGAVNGDIGGALEDLRSNETLKSVGVSMLTAGALAKIDASFFKEISGENIEVSFAQQAQQALSHAAVSSAIQWAADGGNLDELRNGFVNALAMDSISRISKALAKKIGEAAHLPEGERLSVGAKYIAHAGLGCLSGALTSQINGVQTESACYSGAGGGVLGEAIGDLQRSKMNDQLTNWATNVLQRKPTPSELRSKIQEFQAQGVNIAQLTAAFVAFAAGGDVNIAASAARNSAQNNALEIAQLIKEYEEELYPLLSWWSDNGWNSEKGKRARIIAMRNYMAVEEKYKNNKTSPKYQEELRKAKELLADAGLVPLTNGQQVMHFGLLTLSALENMDAGTPKGKTIRLPKNTTDETGIEEIDNIAILDFLIEQKGLADPLVNPEDYEQVLLDYQASIDAQKEVILIKAGTKGAWNSEINSPGGLKPNKRYALSNGHLYTTDSDGRVTRVHGRLEQGIRLDRNEYRQRCVGHEGGCGYDGGHLIAMHLGGAGDGVNIVPMERFLNRRTYRAMEMQLGAALDAGKTVQVAIRVEYPPIISIPKALFVDTWVDGIYERFPFTEN